MKANFMKFRRIFAAASVGGFLGIGAAQVIGTVTPKANAAISLDGSRILNRAAHESDVTTQLILQRPNVVARLKDSVPWSSIPRRLFNIRCGEVAYFPEQTLDQTWTVAKHCKIDR
jgi:hypothetical protein